MRQGEPIAVAALVAWAAVVVMVGLIAGLLTRSPNIALGITLLGGGIYGYALRDRF